MGKLTGIAPDFYVVVQWEAVGRLVEAIGGEAEFVPYFEDDDTETGNIQLSNVDLGIGDMTASFVCFDVQRVNSAREPRLSLVSVTLDPGDDSIASFRAALEALTGVYGAPNNNPFDEAARTCTWNTACWTLLGQGGRAHLSVAAAHVRGLSGAELFAQNLL